MITMDEVNSRLEELAISSQIFWREQGYENTSWPEHIRGLKDFTSLDQFTLGSCFKEDSPHGLILKYIKDHEIQNQYEVIPGTGFCIYKKK